MPEAWTPQRLQDLAPDAGTYQRSLSLVATARWQQRGRLQVRYLWGMIAGSGGTVYRTLADRQTGAHQCSCPVRKTPCKHALALLAGYEQDAFSFRTDSHPQWATDWTAQRAQAETSTQAADSPKGQNEKHQQALAKRIAEMRPGLLEFKTWLQDLVRRGLAVAEQESYDYWYDTATRLVDSKARTAANVIRTIPDLIQAHDDWHPRVFQQLTALYAMAQAFERLDDLPEPLRYDVLSMAGYTYPKRDLMQLPTVADTWEVHGIIQGTTAADPSLTYRRVWLRGQRTQQAALLLDFHHSSQQFEQTYTVGTALPAELIYYPSQVPLRARLLPETIDTPQDFPQWSEGYPLDTLLDQYAQAIGRNPWLTLYPAWLSGVVPVRHDKRLYLRATDGASIPVADHPMLDWQLLALSGGHPLSIMGEWDGHTFVPLSVALPDRLLSLHLQTT